MVLRTLVRPGLSSAGLHLGILQAWVWGDKQDRKVPPFSAGLADVDPLALKTDSGGCLVVRRDLGLPAASSALHVGKPAAPPIQDQVSESPWRGLLRLELAGAKATAAGSQPRLLGGCCGLF
jgi:hypothetical protein